MLGMLDGLRNEKRQPYPLATFWADLRAGTTLVASFVPAAMAVGLLSGLGPIAGLWCGVVVGIVSAIFGGTRALISGPSAVLAVISATLIFGNEMTLPELAVVIVMAGIIQIGLGLGGVGRFVSYMPHIVLTGFISGIGVLLLASQASELLSLGLSEVLLAALCLIVVWIWPARLGRYLPASLAAVGAGVIATLIVPDFERLGPVPVGLPKPIIALPSADFIPEALGPAVLIALISSVNTLMWSLVADTFTGSRHNPNRELVSLGVGNILAGIIGAMPGSGNIATLSARRYGGKTVGTGIVCLLIVAALILGFGPYVAPLPLAALSAIVIVVGWRMIEFSFLRKIPRMDPKYSTVMLLVMGVTIFVDPVFAILFGVIAANIVNAAQLESLELDSVVSTPLLDCTFSDEATDEFTARIGLVAFRGSFTVSSSRKLIGLIGADIREHEVVILDLSKTTHMDDSAAHLLAQILDRAKQVQTKIVVCGLNDRVWAPLFAFDVLDRIPKDRIVDTETDARNLAWSLL